MVRSRWGTTPRESIRAEARRRGRAGVVEGCVRMLRREEVDDGLLRALAGPATAQQLDPDDHWLRVWALRGLLWVWDPVTPDPAATGEVVTALADPAWRVREMAAKVVARHRVDDALDAVAALAGDENVRVRRAGERALQRLVADPG